MLLSHTRMINSYLNISGDGQSASVELVFCYPNTHFGFQCITCTNIRIYIFLQPSISLHLLYGLRYWMWHVVFQSSILFSVGFLFYRRAASSHERFLRYHLALAVLCLFHTCSMRNALGLSFPLFLDYKAFRGPLLVPLLLGTLYSMSFCALCRIVVIIHYVSNCSIPGYTFCVAHSHFNSPFSCKPARYSAESKYLLPGDFL